MRSLLIPLVLGLLPTAAGAQFVSRPYLDWRTIETEHFTVHYPAQYREWTQSVAARLESARTAVGDIVGFVPARRVQVLVDDPTNASNGFALPFVDQPTMVFFPVPPSPRQSIGNSRDWGELLAIHEFAHLAHLARPSRNPLDLWRLLPVQLGPIARRAPRWVTEGFATYVEGRVTGSGRPHNAQRAAVLRQWALEGRLPTYAQLSGSRAFNGGAFAYLGGSAYLEWLAGREGDSTITHLWRRMTARTTRSFPRAFTGVYGQSPEALYGRFTVELTRSALAVEARIDSLGGGVEGELVQRLSWETGDPAISPDGSRVALVLRSPTRPGRIVVWNTGPDSVSPRAAAERVTARERARMRDTLDVPDRRFYPPARRVLAELGPRDGRGFDAPRFMPDGRQVLVTRAEPIGGGAFRPDLYMWDTKSGAVRRITRGAAVRQADPAPDGRSAAAVRCTRGWCDLVQVDLASGAVTMLREGSPSLTYFRPRVSPAGDRIVVAVQQQDQWRLEILDARDAARPANVVVGDRATRFDAAWADSSTLVAASEASGIANLERIDVATGRAQPITRVTGAAYGPEVDRASGATWFLSLHALGLDVRRLPPGSEPVILPAINPDEFPAVPVRPASSPPALAAQGGLAEKPYGLGPRSVRWLPGASVDAGAASAQLLVMSGDPVGRLELALLGAVGTRAAWRGARAWATVRRWRPAFTGEVFHASQQPRDVAGVRAPAMDASVSGAAVRTTGRVDRSAWRANASFGIAAMQVRGAAAGTAPGNGSARSIGWTSAEISGAMRKLDVSVAALAAVRAAAGRHGDATVGHVVASGALRVDLPLVPPVQAQVVRARNASGAGAPPFEQIVVGGAAPVLLDAALMPQRHAMPVLPAGTLVGSAATIARADLVLGLLTPYLWTARVDGALHRGWKRVAGLEARFNSSAIPLVTVPRVELVAGAGHSMDAPFPRTTALYLNIAYRP